MFKFNFGFEEKSNDKPSTEPCSTNKEPHLIISSKKDPEVEKEIVFMAAHAMDFIPNDRPTDINTVWKKDNFELKIIKLDATENVSDPIVKEAVARTDVETGVYEGGFKV